MQEDNTSLNIRQADLKSVEELCKSTWKPLYRFIYYRVQNREEAEDMTQETYIRALSHMEKSPVKIDRYISYLKTVSLNILRDRWRKKKRSGTAVNLEQANPGELIGSDHTEQYEQRTLITNALQELKDEYRTVIELRIIKGYSAAEAASIMNKTEGNIRVIQYRALQALAAKLGSNN